MYALSVASSNRSGSAIPLQACCLPANGTGDDGKRRTGIDISVYNLLASVENTTSGISLRQYSNHAVYMLFTISAWMGLLLRNAVVGNQW